MTRILWVLGGLLLFTVPSPAASWLTEFGVAQQRVAAENKPMLIFFTGSDWCPACQKLNMEVFQTTRFGKYADDNLVLLQVDFPRRKPLPPARQQANEALARSYNVRHYPTLVLLDTQLKEVGRPANTGNGPHYFMTALDHLVHKFKPGGSSVPRMVSYGDNSQDPPAPLFNGAPVAPPKQYAELTLKSISGPKEKRLALLNNQTLAEGETARVKLLNKEVKVRCVEIRQDSILVSVEGQEAQREIRLAGSK